MSFLICPTVSAKSNAIGAHDYMQVAQAKYQHAGNFNRCDSIREVQRLGRTAKEIAAEIGEELIKVKYDLAHGEFGPWCEGNLSFSRPQRQRYMQAAEIKKLSRERFDRANSIREVLEIKGKPTPKQELRAAKAEGRYKGRKATAVAKSGDIRKLANEGMKPLQIAKELGIGKSSVYRILNEAEEQAKAALSH